MQQVQENSEITLKIWEVWSKCISHKISENLTYCSESLAHKKKKKQYKMTVLLPITYIKNVSLFSFTCARIMCLYQSLT